MICKQCGASILSFVDFNNCSYCSNKPKKEITEEKFKFFLRLFKEAE